MRPMTGSASPTHEGELQDGALAGRLNWLRAGVLGANDGIVSVAGIVAGVAGASTDRRAIAISGIAGLVAGALSMAAGEYVSVSTQRDSERAMLRTERRELQQMPDIELEELTEIYQNKGLDRDLAARVAEQLTDRDALAAHADAELGIDPDALTNPWQAAGASLLSFTVGALIPLIAILLPAPHLRVAVCFVAVALALVVTGSISSRLGSAPMRPAIVRNVVGGMLAMAITYGVGTLVGTAV